MRPPRVYLRATKKLTRQRERSGDSTSRTLSFTFAKGTGGGDRSAVGFVSPEDVPEFEGETAWFEMEAVERGNGRPWSWWRAVRQVEPPADA
jgi:hypothetical protein